MNPVQALTDTDLIRSTEALVQKEREIVSEVIEHLREIESRRLYAKRGHSSLFAYCTEELKYCPASAQLRIDAVRLSREVPEVKEALEDGRVTLSSVGLLQKFIRAEKPEIKEKRELFQAIEGKSKHETEKFLASISPTAMETPKEEVKAARSGRTRLTFEVDEEDLWMLEEMKMKLRKKGNPDPSLADVFHEAMRRALGVKDAASPGEPKLAHATSPGEVGEKRPFIAVAIRREVRAKAGEQCTYVSPITGRQCKERLNLQYEHQIPFGKGGSSDAVNLTLHCPAHNRLRAIEEYGAKKMGRYLSK